MACGCVSCLGRSRNDSHTHEHVRIAVMLLNASASMNAPIAVLWSARGFWVEGAIPWTRDCQKCSMVDPGMPSQAQGGQLNDITTIGAGCSRCRKWVQSRHQVRQQNPNNPVDEEDQGVRVSQATRDSWGRRAGHMSAIEEELTLLSYAPHTSRPTAPFCCSPRRSPC